MNKSKKKGFTLVELLVTIVLLGVIGAIVIYNMTSVSTTSKETDYDRYINSIKSAAGVYADLNQDAFNELYVSKSYIYITIGDLIDAGLLDETLTNPYTEEVVNPDELIKVNLDTTNGNMVFEYPVEETETESFLVSMSDYVVWGETYNCMQGAGTYELAISKENGDLVLLNDETIKEYNFTCKFPSEFSVSGNYGRTEKSGTYEIEYSWITESGTKKKSTRTLKVLDKIKPSFKFNYSYESRNSNAAVYEAKYNGNGSWDTLKYVPYIEGADPSTTKVTIYKKSNNPNGDWQLAASDTQDKILSTYDYRDVDDGDKTYRIISTIIGHYDSSYSYTAEDKAYVKSELEVPTDAITNLTSDSCATNRNFMIKNYLNSPVGVAKYEYKLSDSDTAPDKTSEILTTYEFDVNENHNTGECAAVTGDCAIKNVSVLDSTNCSDTLKQYKYVYFRAINKDGYAGKWSRLFTQTLLSNSTSCLLTYKSYSPGEVYFNYGNTTFRVLQVLSGGYVYATNTATNGTGKLITPTVISKGYAEQVTCDMTVYKYYDYSSPVVNIITDELTNWITRNGLPNTKMVNRSYSLGGGVYRNLYATTFAMGGGTFNYYDYDGLLYKDQEDYWTTTSYYSGFTVYLDQPHKHANESTTAYNGFFYYTNGSGLAGQRYVGQSAYVKPIVEFKTMNICTGDGSSTNPYRIGL